LNLFFTNYFPHYVEKSIKKMAGESQSMMKTLNPHPMKIDIVQFDGTNNFGMWRCEVIDTLITLNLENALQLKEKPKETSEKDLDKMNRMVCSLIRSYLT